MVKKSGLVSVIMNCFNGAEYLKEAIDSIYAQSYNNWEIIFWDNCSIDDSSLIAKSYDNKLRYFQAERHTALGKARNLALREARGEYVAFLDCDDEFIPEKIKIQLKAMQENNAILSYGSWIKINQNGEELKEYRVQQQFGNMFELLLSKYVVNFQTLMIKNSLLIENNLNFDSNLKFSTDHNLILRIAYNWPILSINDVLAKYRVHGGSMSNNRKSEKLNDFDYTISFLRGLGAQEKYQNFTYSSSKARLELLLLDAFDERDFTHLLKLTSKYLSLVIIMLFKKVRSGNGL